MDTQNVLHFLRELLAARGHPFALAGAFAVNAYGMARFTSDIDLVVPLAAQQLLVDGMETRGYETLRRAEGYSNHLHRDPLLGRVDFIYVDAATAAKLFPQCRKTTLGDLSDVLVPRPEHLIAMKVHAIKSNPPRRLKDLADIQYLLRNAGANVDEARGYFEAAGLRGDWDEITKTL